MIAANLSSRRGSPWAVGEIRNPAEGISAVRVVATERGVSRIDLLPRPSDFEAWIAAVASELDAAAAGVGIERGGAIVDGVLEELRKYFRGRLRVFRTRVVLDGRGTPFQHRVWEALREIPFGTTRSYGEIAARLRRPRAARAVGQANGRNPVPIVIPCHRVVSSDGGLGGFSGGLGLKRALLRVEGHAV